MVGKSVGTGKPVIKKNTNTAEKATLSLLLHELCKKYNLQLYEEVMAIPDRKFRFDWAIPAIKVAIEYEGLFSEKSRHTTIEGFTKDCEKYNLTQLNGWKVFRYTAVNYQQAYQQIDDIINQLIEK